MTKHLLSRTMILAAATVTLSAAAQTHSASHTAHTVPSAHPSATANSCATIPEVTSKVPAVPAGSPCIKALYSIVTEPNAKLDNTSGFAGPDVARTLGIESNTITEYYVDTKPGTGALALPDKWYQIQYTGYLTDGTKFDSSLDRGEPIAIHYGAHQVIPGWDTGFGGMHVGGRRRLFIPYQLAYGAQPHGPIPAKAMLIFDVELVSQSDTEPAPKPKPAAPATSPVAHPAPPAQPAAGTVTPPSPATAPATQPAPAEKPQQ